MANRIISYYTDISTQGRVKLTFITDDEEERTVAFEKPDIGNLAALCALLNHATVEFEMIEDEPHFKISKILES